MYARNICGVPICITTCYTGTSHQIIVYKMILKKTLSLHGSLLCSMGTSLQQDFYFSFFWSKKPPRVLLPGLSVSKPMTMAFATMRPEIKSSVVFQRWSHPPVWFFDECWSHITTEINLYLNTYTSYIYIYILGIYIYIYHTWLYV